MRLLNTTTYELKDFEQSLTPKYAILSHRWGVREVSYQDYRKKRVCAGPGYDRIVQACDFARLRSYDYIWIDTCCIDKRSSAELSEAINSMWSWYANALECIAYLADVSISDPGYLASRFTTSDWFLRAWTLQELIAPRFVTFCSVEWEVIGGKYDLQREIHLATSIPVDVLRWPERIENYSAAQKMSWASRRESTRIEDETYCLLGLFGINMPLLYGERHEAFARLLERIMATSMDESLLAWNAPWCRQIQPVDNRFDKHDSYEFYRLLASSPASYAGAADIVCHSAPECFPRFNVEGGLVKLTIGQDSDVVQLSTVTHLVQLRCCINFARPPTRCYLALIRRFCGHFDSVIRHYQDGQSFQREYPEAEHKKLTTGTLYIHPHLGHCRRINPTNGVHAHAMDNQNTVSELASLFSKARLRNLSTDDNAQDDA